MDIKDILKLQGRVSFPYKTEMKEWIGDITLSSYTDTYGTGELYYIISQPYEKIKDVDEAILKFKKIAFSEDNLGIKQSLWNSLNPDKDPEDMDPDDMEKEVRTIKIKDYE